MIFLLKLVKKLQDYFLTLSNPPDAVFAVEDFSALGLMKGLKERIYKYPDEMGIIGFANEEFDEYITPTLSSIDQQTVQMGREAFNMLLGIIEGRKCKSKPGIKDCIGTYTFLQGIVIAKRFVDQFAAIIEKRQNK